MYKSLMVTCMISFLISLFSTGDVSFGAEISGFSLLILSLILIAFIVITKYITKLRGDMTFLNILSAIVIGAPFILIFAIIGFVLYLLINYKNKISNGQVSSDYYTFNLWFIIVLLIETYYLYTNLNSPDFEINGKISSLTISILYLMSVILCIISITLYVILSYYQTDGFKNLNIK